MEFNGYYRTKVNSKAFLYFNSDCYHQDYKGRCGQNRNSECFRVNFLFYKNHWVLFNLQLFSIVFDLKLVCRFFDFWSPFPFYKNGTFNNHLVSFWSFLCQLSELYVVKSYIWLDLVKPSFHTQFYIFRNTDFDFLKCYNSRRKTDACMKFAIIL